MKTPEGEHSRQVRQEGVTVPSSSGDSVRSIAQPSAESQGGVRESRRVVDENGEPMVVYHGTNKYGFTVFDRRQERPYNALALRDGEYGPNPLRRLVGGSSFALCDFTPQW